MRYRIWSLSEFLMSESSWMHECFSILFVSSLRAYYYQPKAGYETRHN